MIRFLFSLWQHYDLTHNAGPSPASECPACAWGEDPPALAVLVQACEMDLLDAYRCPQGHLFLTPRWTNWPSFRWQSRCWAFRADLVLSLRRALRRLSPRFTGKDA